MKILVRGDGAFGVPKMIRTCRRLKVNFLFGKPQNPRLHAHSVPEQLQAAVAYTVTQRSERIFGEFRYQAKSWRQAERVIVKAEVTQRKLNPRFVVTDLAAEDGWTPQAVYGRYCERGDRPRTASRSSRSIWERIGSPAMPRGRTNSGCCCTWRPTCSSRRCRTGWRPPGWRERKRARSGGRC